MAKLGGVTHEDINLATKGMSPYEDDRMTHATAASEKQIGTVHRVPLVLPSKSKLDEKDLLKMCVDNPRYLSKALGHEDDTTGLVTLEEKKEMLAYFYKSWSGLAKYIYNQCHDQGKVVDFPLVGKFHRRPRMEGDSSYKFCFVPHIDFMASGKFSFPQNDSNISPLSKRVPKGGKVVRVSLGAIGQRADYDRELVASILKDSMVKFIEANRFGKEVILNLKIGRLHAYPNGELQFEDLRSDEDDLDNEVVGVNKKRYQARNIANDRERHMNERNLEHLARAMSSNAPSVNVKSCFQSIRTPATQKSAKSQMSRHSQMSGYGGTVTKGWYRADPFANQYAPPLSQAGAKSNNAFPKNRYNTNGHDMYSQLSKQTHLTYTTIQSRTQSRLEKDSESRKGDMLANLKKNQFIPPETLEQFITKQKGERPAKKMYFEKQPGPSDKQALLQEYLKVMADRESAKQEHRLAGIAQQKVELGDIHEDVRNQIEMRIADKEEKVQMMRKNIQDVQAERDATMEQENYHRVHVKPITAFPYTHGDTVEAARAAMKEELVQDLKNRQAVQESIEREKYGSDVYDQMNRLNQDEGEEEEVGGLKRDLKLYPQGGDKQVMLRDKFQQSAPFYLKHNKPVFARKTNEDRYQSTLEQARGRFEDQLRVEKDMNQKSLEEYQLYMDETSKFNELKKLKESQNRMLVRSLLEQQMEQDKEKRLKSSHNRRSNPGGEMTLGPRETDETIQYQLLKKHHDVRDIRRNLQEQIMASHTDDNKGLERQIVMDRYNVGKAHKEVANQMIWDKHRIDQQNNAAKDEWVKQKMEISNKKHVATEFKELA